jgi:hypothetical protein
MVDWPPAGLNPPLNLCTYFPFLFLLMKIYNKLLIICRNCIYRNYMVTYILTKIDIYCAC